MVTGHMSAKPQDFIYMSTQKVLAHHPSKCNNMFDFWKGYKHQEY